MKCSYVVSSGLGYQISNLARAENHEEFEKALECLHDNGFDGVELNLHFDNKLRLAKIRDSIHDAGLKIAAIGTGLLYAHEKLSLTDSDQYKRDRAISIIQRLLKFASDENASLIIGSVRGQAEKKHSETRLRNCLVKCDSAARRCGTRIALEAINRYETRFLNTASEVTAFIESVGLESTGILLDTFHMNIEEQSIEEAINTCKSGLVHFHIADSNRWPPGYGHMKIENILHQLEDSGYAGWVSAETLPKPSSIEAVKATAKFLRTHHFI